LLQPRVVAVTLLTLQWRVLVNDYDLVSEHFGLRVALGAGDIGVATGKSEMGFGVMVKSRRNPVLGVVTVRTMRLGILNDELAVMDILVTGFALLRGALEP